MPGKTHIPFAWAMPRVLRPTTLVELGTYKGDSYCTFCQGVSMLKLPATKCFAVDRWKGDELLGCTTTAFSQELKAYHDPMYGSFSQLIEPLRRGAPPFTDGSVDLLHIDGMHTYDAVKHDFETWLPKMSVAASSCSRHQRSGARLRRRGSSGGIKAGVPGL